MVGSCAKCGKSIDYGLICGQCLLGSSLGSDITNKMDDTDKSSERYKSTSMQNHYSRFEGFNNGFRIIDKAAKEAALKKYLRNNRDTKRYNSTMTHPVEPKTYSVLVNDLVSKIIESYGLKDKKDVSNIASTINIGLDYIIVTSKDSKSTYFIPIRKALDSSSRFSSDDGYVRSGTYMNGLRDYGFANGTYTRGNYIANGTYDKSQGTYKSSKGSSASSSKGSSASSSASSAGTSASK
jgi:hypothetical protein